MSSAQADFSPPQASAKPRDDDDFIAPTQRATMPTQWLQTDTQNTSTAISRIWSDPASASRERSELLGAVAQQATNRISLLINSRRHQPASQPTARAFPDAAAAENSFRCRLAGAREPSSWWRREWEGAPPTDR
ncbi:hypothetical protein CDD83_6672 [Cordyceps sp. RAO-2017]|nr:hypothetical protein CDD83_6672 [Cordyceps sp. RAO-2017]